jgi:hypothetical protein
MKTLKMRYLKIMFILLFIAVTVNQAQESSKMYGLSQEEYKLWIDTFNYQQLQPIPTYHVMIMAEDERSFSVHLEGSYIKPSGEIIKINHDAPLPISFYVNADCHLKLKITTDDDRKFISLLFYQYQETSKWLGTCKGIKGAGASYIVPPYKE